MKRIIISFLQAIVVLIALGAVVFLLGEPHLEGRNAHSTLFEVYFKDPFLAYVYLASIPFFVALYQAFKVLSYVGQNQLFSPAALHALRLIKYCAIAMLIFVAGSVGFLIFADDDDRPAGVFLRIIVALPSLVMATTAATLEHRLQNALANRSRADRN